MGISILCAVWIISGIYGVTSQGDSLRSALNAVDRRQRYLFENYPALYAQENPADLSYLPDSVSVGGSDFGDYFSDGENDVGKQISSSFRERLEEDRDKQLEELSQRILSNLGNEDSFDNVDYRPRGSWHKYRNNPYSRNSRMPSHNRKRQFYPEFGYDSIGLRKRDKYIPNEYSNDYNYLLNVNDDYPNDYDNLDYSKRSYPYREHEERYENHPNYWSNFRHIPVSKRSSEYPNISKDNKQTAKTDPKVEKDLSSVFAGSEKKKVQKYPKKADEAEKKKENQSNSNNSKAKIEIKKNDTKKVTEEVVPITASEKPIQISKKSIDWSDYFGLDRRKKNKDDFDKEWIMERYHKAIAVSKKNTEYPLQSFHDHDMATKKKKMKNDFDEVKMENLDRKLKSVEDEIVDDALKYTGSNEGVTDPKDIQEVKDGIISRLAKAYSIEKMRRALGEYKMLVDKEREKIAPEKDDIEDDSFAEEKRISVPRKQAVDPNKDEQIEDNRIKCTDGKADCEEENYKTPIEVIEQMNYEVGGCPKIQRDCSQVAPLLGPYGKIFDEACNSYQMCLLCGNNSWYPATRQCNILYLSKIFDMCDGKTECQKELQKSVRYLMNINRNLRNNPSGECNIVCPDGPSDGP